MDIALGESASACNFTLTKEHISNLRVMVATRCTSAEEDHEVPRKQIKMKENDEATSHADKEIVVSSRLSHTQAKIIVVS